MNCLEKLLLHNLLLADYKYHYSNSDHHYDKGEQSKELLRIKLYSEDAVAVVLNVFKYSTADDGCQKSARTADAILYCKCLGNIFFIYVAVCYIKGVLIKSSHRSCVKNGKNNKNTAQSALKKTHGVRHPPPGAARA